MMRGIMSSACLGLVIVSRLARLLFDRLIAALFLSSVPYSGPRPPGPPAAAAVCAPPPPHPPRPLKIRDEADPFSMELGVTEKGHIVRVVEVIIQRGQWRFDLLPNCAGYDSTRKPPPHGVGFFWVLKERQRPRPPVINPEILSVYPSKLPFPAIHVEIIS